MVNTLAVAGVVTTAPALITAATASVSGLKYATASKQQRTALRTAYRVRRTWPRTVREVGLYQTDQSAKVGSEIPLAGELRRGRTPRLLVPELRVHTDPYGLVIDVKTVGRIGIDEFRKASGYLADRWRVPSVQVHAVKPGWLRLRIMLRDPLIVPVTQVPEVADVVDLVSWLLGTDQDGKPATVRSSGVSGVVVSGLSGYGKTSLINGRLCQLFPSSAVQFVMIDGKGGPDYDDLTPRAWRHCKDDLVQARDILREVDDLRRQRQAQIRSQLGVKNLWQIGPSATWPLVLVIIDEAHTFFYESKGRDAASKDHDALSLEIRRLVEEGIRKSRNVGIQYILATQKASGDAIPTFIRDNCQIAISFAQRTSEAAIAALGSDINDYPHAHPRRLQSSDYIGVASVAAEGRPGFTLVRNPYVADEDAARMATDTAHLTADPIELLNVGRVADLVPAQPGPVD
jgi:S-DNA-T family DNA segregation ATPase FtsK/SpoIIIE